MGSSSGPSLRHDVYRCTVYGCSAYLMCEMHLRPREDETGALVPTSLRAPARCLRCGCRKPSDKEEWKSGDAAVSPPGPSHQHQSLETWPEPSAASPRAMRCERLSEASGGAAAGSPSTLTRRSPKHAHGAKGAVAAVARRGAELEAMPVLPSGRRRGRCELLARTF